MEFSAGARKKKTHQHYMRVIPSNPCAKPKLTNATLDIGEPKHCTLTNATFGCPSTNEFLEGIGKNQCCCPCPTGKAKREGEPRSIHCNESDEKSGITPSPSPSSTTDQPAMENTSSSTTARTTPTSVSRSSTTTTSPMTEAATTPNHITNSTQNTTKETTGAENAEGHLTPVCFIIIAALSLLLLIAVLIIVWLVWKLQCQCRLNCHSDGPSDSNEVGRERDGDPSEMIPLYLQNSQIGAPPVQSTTNGNQH